MTTSASDLARETGDDLADVERARQGDHDAFVRLYRRDAPAAWRLALALAADAELAAQAMAEGFRRTLAPARAGATRTEVPSQLRVLRATRHAAIDGPALDAGRLLSASPVTGADPISPRSAQAMDAFHQLPERSRTILWLLVVEGLGTLEAGWVLGMRPRATEDLAERSVAALDEQWLLDRRAEGRDPDEAPADLHLALWPLVPLPLELVALTEAHWSSSRTRPLGPLHLALPGGRSMPRWAERTLVGTTAGLIAMGITAALAIDRDPTLRPGRDRTTAALGHDDTDTDTGPGAGTDPSSAAALDQEEDGLSGGTVAASASEPSLYATGVEATSSGSATPATQSSTIDKGASPSPTSTVPPLLQVTLGTGPALGVAVGDCTGIELAGTVAGCPPATKDEGLTLDVGGTLLGG